MPESTYQNIPGSGTRRQGFALSACRNRLYLAEDHLLSVDRTPYSETYKRFYFRDVQALILQPTERRGKWNIAFGVGLVLFLMVLGYNYSGRDFPIFSSVMVCLFFILILVNTLRGPTCRLHLRTAVQEEELAACQRLGAARRAIALIVARVTAVQKRPSREEIAALTAAAEAAARPAAAPPPSDELPPPPIETPPASGEPAAAPGATAPTAEV
jgi:hypothetical protein